jgi:VanZ family protein
MILFNERRIHQIGRAGGWLLAIAILVLSVVPPWQRPVTGVVSSNFEHLTIWLLTGLAFATGYRDRLLAVTGGVLMFAGLIELVQLLAPGRHARLSDFLIDGAAALAGVALFVFVRRGVFMLARRASASSHVKRM